MATPSEHFAKYSPHVLSGLLVLVALVCIGVALVPEHRLLKAAVLAWILIP